MTGVDPKAHTSSARLLINPPAMTGSVMNVATSPAKVCVDKSVLVTNFLMKYTDQFVERSGVMARAGLLGNVCINDWDTNFVQSWKKGGVLEIRVLKWYLPLE